MPYQVRKRENQSFTLVELDPEGETTVTIRPATGKDQLRMEQMVTKPTYSYKLEDFGKVDERPATATYLEQMAKAWCVLVSCNILDEDGGVLLQDDMKWDAWTEAWSKLDADAREEIYGCVVQVNPHWGN